MRLNPFSPSDNPMEKHLYCFGGDGGGGGGDGTDDGDVGTAGHGGGVAPGGQASDAQGNFGGGGSDSLGFDEGDVGGVSPGGRAQAPGPSGGFSDSPGLAAAYGGAGPAAFGARPVRVSFTPPRLGGRPDGRTTAVPGFAPPSISPTDVVSDPEGIAAAQARNAISGVSDITSGEQTGTTDLSTMVNPMDDLDPFGDRKSEEEHAANMAALALSLPSLSAPVARGPGIPGVPGVPGAPGRPQSTTPVADITVTYGPKDLAEAEAALADARADAYGDKQFGLDTGLPESIDVFGIEVPTTVGLFEGLVDALTNPEASTANAIAERGIRSVDGQSAVGTPNYNPNGLDITTSGGPVTEGGRAVARDPMNNVVFDTNPFGGLGPGAPGVPQNIQDVYDQAAAVDDAARDRGGDGGGDIPPTALPDPVTQECPAGYVRDGSGVCVYQGQDVVRPGLYTPGPAPTFNYTGIPSLAPFRLQPTARPAAQPVDPFALLRAPRS